MRVETKCVRLKDFDLIRHVDEYPDARRQHVRVGTRPCIELMAFTKGNVVLILG